MANLTLKLKQPKPNHAGKRRVNLYLRGWTAQEGAEAAAERYGYCMSELVDRLLEEELKSKKGLLFGLDHHSSDWRRRRRKGE